MRCKHNKPGIKLWNAKQKSCTIVELIIQAADMNVAAKVQEKENIYSELTSLVP